MTNWNTFADAAPDLASRCRAVLASSTNAVLATLRADGSPRLSGIDPWFSPTSLCFGSMPGARKLADLERNPTMALHSVPYESRRPPEGADVDSVIQADVKVDGRAIPALDLATMQELSSSFAETRGFEMPGDPAEGTAGLFTIELTAVTMISVAEDQLVIERWTPAAGYTSTQRS